MNIKKLLCLALALCMVVGLMAACGESEKKGSEKDTEPTEPLAGPMFETDPADDDTLNILMIGNSFCYYYPDELWGMLDAAGIKARVCNVYASGCTIEEHWDWWFRDIANYEIYATYDEKGRTEEEWWTLRQCLEQHNWDIITLQESSFKIFEKDPADSYADIKPYLNQLFPYLEQKFPQAKMYWHQTWAFQLGFDNFGYACTSREDQEIAALKNEQHAKLVCDDFGLTLINTGAAWEIVRDGGYDNLCARLAIKNGAGDNYHEGDIGGGQYLNACVWFETLTGKSCIGNTWRPIEYQLDPALIPVLQEAAHEIVGATG